MAEQAVQKKSAVRAAASRKTKVSFLQYFRQNFSLYLMALPGVLLMVVFKYIPMYGTLIAFEQYSPAKGIFNSTWVGFDQFVKFFNSPYFSRLIGNTFLLGIWCILFCFPAPILLALLLNEVRAPRYKRLCQSISYIPYFISTVIVIGLFKEMLSVNDGIVNNLIAMLGGQKIDFFASSQWFRPLYVITALWSVTGYKSIIYLSAISGVNPELYESAVLDGASRFKQAIHITLPSISSTIVILFIMDIGNIVSTDCSKILLMYSPLTYDTADVISTYVYREGILGGSYSYTTAINLFMSLISLAFVLSANWMSRKLSDTSLF